MKGGNCLVIRHRRASFTRGPRSVKMAGLGFYCTLTVTLWVAVTGSWSLVAPVTVTLCVPLLRLFSVPAKPF